MKKYTNQQILELRANNVLLQREANTRIILIKLLNKIASVYDYISINYPLYNYLLELLNCLRVRFTRDYIIQTNFNIDDLINTIYACDNYMIYIDNELYIFESIKNIKTKKTIRILYNCFNNILTDICIYKKSLERLHRVLDLRNRICKSK